MTPLYLAAGVVLLVLLWGVLTYNALVRSRNRVDQSWSGVDVQLKRRRDLVPNLVTVVEASAEHEQQTLTELTEARADAVAASGRVWRERCERRLTGALLAVHVAVEPYPDLQTSNAYRELQRQLTEVEDDIVGARRIFNSNVQRFNDLVQTFPASFVAGFGSFTPRQYFDVETSAERAVPTARRRPRTDSPAAPRQHDGAGQSGPRRRRLDARRSPAPDAPRPGRRVRARARHRRRGRVRRLAGRAAGDAGGALLVGALVVGTCFALADRRSEARVLHQLRAGARAEVRRPDRAAPADAAARRRRSARVPALDAGTARRGTAGRAGSATTSSRCAAVPGAARARTSHDFTICVVDIEPGIVMYPGVFVARRPRPGGPARRRALARHRPPARGGARERGAARALRAVGRALPGRRAAAAALLAVVRRVARRASAAPVLRVSGRHARRLPRAPRSRTRAGSAGCSTRRPRSRGAFSKR